MKCAVLPAAAMLVLTAGMARAHIFEWRDADGTRHFTNRKTEIPVAEGIQVVVTEPAAKSAPAAPPASAAPVASETRRQALVVYDDSSERDAYAEGLQQGLALAARGGDTVQIFGPLAVVDASPRWPAAPVPVYGYPYDWYPYYSYPFYSYPLVATSVRRGRAHHHRGRWRFGQHLRRHPRGSLRLPNAAGPSLNPLHFGSFRHASRRGAGGLF